MTRPGQIKLSVEGWPEEDSLEVDLEAGRTYFVRISLVGRGVFTHTRTYLKIEKRDSGRYRLCKVQGINSDIPKESAAWSWLTSICEAISSSRTDFEIGSRYYQLELIPTDIATQEIKGLRLMKPCLAC
ncbi:hypothetical protein NSPZN2_100293 [Nitrospira defluvii]|uniref:Uncharacterized protein n=1 Tax=Nitrospira defluvii TaxID=330214 RepID=A0ABM8R2X5_9BACT|nr:hypothetical protein NSPZN2_100293 [Nitrospira defluvii]